MKKQSLLALLLLTTLSTTASNTHADVVVSKVPQDLFVRFESDLSESQQTLLLARKGLQIEWRSSLVPGLVRVKNMNGAGDANALAESMTHLNASDGILYAEPNYRSHRKLAPAPKPVRASSSSFSAPSDPYFARQWALNGDHGVNPSGAWEKTTGSRDIRVAVLDTGVQADHPELSDRLLAGYDFIDGKSDPVDTHGHGTHVSGIIGARWDNSTGIAGINREVSFIPVRVVPNDDDETDANLIEAFEFAVKEGARVANCSFGKKESGTAVRDVIEAAGTRGLLVVAAAGNESRDIGRTPSFPASFQTSNMIVVASTTVRGSLSFFSNYSGKLVNIAAPGSAILSAITNSGYASWDGTSMAAPQVAGVAALTLAANPKLSTSQLKEIILSTAATRPSLAGKVSTGGTVDATAAVMKALETETTQN